ncbi:hypothetical protein E1293_17695 [Actinomadura darangshiensis]|uniref:CHAT domain-containing protein n=1 Tax=Actinomadura darangshiensis TaxID=705336 RepID=A0A4R5BEB8_9ACTN|nr:CHAT domain-containing protein [Actinomadura darangshiensis]TDD81942.1 hypothetical protein E1293_17695 [Actinomadura darangshiensis]
MPSSGQIRGKIAELTKERARHEGKLATAQSKQQKKLTEANSYQERARKASSPSRASSYLRSAESANKAALAEGKKIETERKAIAKCAGKEATLNKDLQAALAREAKDDQRQRERQHKEEERRRQQLAAAERTRTEALVAASEERMSVVISRLQPPKVEPLRILYLTAAAAGDLRVGEEIRRVKAAVRSATLRDLVQIEHMPSATASDLLDGLTRFRPHVVHFSGHANKDFLEFDSGLTERGPGKTVAAAAFAEAIDAVDLKPKVIVLNACHSYAHVDGLLEIVPLAISMTDRIGDVDAITFATRFYAAVTEGQSVEAACKLTKADMRLNGLPDADLPVLSHIPEVDPSTTMLIIPPQQL